MEIVSKFQKVHGDKFDYSKVKYIKAKTKVVVICKIHGDFLITPNNHLNGCGCPKCCGRGFTDEENISRFKIAAKEIHGDKYDYSKIKSVSGKMPIECKIHGEFLQGKISHLAGSGCPKCGISSASVSRMLGLDEFMRKSIEKHGSIYDYSKVDYRGAHKKVTIICTKHGEFLVTAANHWSNGVGCPVCFNTSASKGEQLIKCWLDSHKTEYESQKTFPNLKIKSKLKYDFYLPKLNTLIEFDGEYHYRPITYSKLRSGEEQLKITQFRDNLKTKFAEDNFMRLLRIRFDDDISTVLTENLTSE